MPRSLSRDDAHIAAAIKIVQSAIAARSDGDSAAAHGALETLAARASDLTAAQLRIVELERQLGRQRDEIAELRERAADLRAAEDQRALALSDISRLKTDFALSVSHELRTPMAIIKASLDALDLNWQDVPDERRRAYVAVARRGACRLKRLLENLLLVSRIETGAHQMRVETVDVGAVAASAIAAAVAEWPRRSISGCAPMPLSPVRTDRALALEALSYLLENALKSVPEDVPIGVAVATADGGVVVRIGTTEGLGVLPGSSELGPRGAPGEAATPADFGVCLDLQIAQQLATRIGGRVWAEAGASGQMTYALALPARLDRSSLSGVATRAPIG